MNFRIVLSPAKSLDWESELPSLQFTQPELLPQAKILMDELKQYSVVELEQLMKISTKLATLNVDRNHSWQEDHTEGTRPAIYAFNGDVYEGLDAYSLSEKSALYAQEHLRVLSGLYGILRPLDLIYPYRLEMGTSMPVQGKKNLYGFWDNTVVDILNRELGADDYLINLASNEYFKVIPKKALNAQVITPAFYDYKNGKYKVISFYAKKARGMMARFIVDNPLTDMENLKAFDVDGYAFSEPMSKGNTWAFTRG